MSLDDPTDFPFRAENDAAGNANPSDARLAGRDLRRIGVWQLAGPLERRVVEGTRDDVPSAEATPVWHFDGGGPGTPGYRDAGDYARTVRVYHVEAFPGDRRDQIASLAEGASGEVAIPRYAAGDRVYAEFNAQSGRWEVLGPAEDVWRFELKTALVSNGLANVPSTAEAYLVVYDAGEGRYVRTAVEFPVADFLGRPGADPGTRGYAKRMADAHPNVGWEIVVLGTSQASSSSSA